MSIELQAGGPPHSNPRQVRRRFPWVGVSFGLVCVGLVGGVLASAIVKLQDAADRMH